MWKALFPGSGNQSGEGNSLLEDWNTYSSGGTRDVEAGTSGRGTGLDTLFQSADKAGNFLQDSFSSVSKSVTSGVAAIPGSLPSAESFRSVRQVRARKVVRT